MIALLLNHLWQSSLFVGAAALLALSLHRNGANVRFWLWFAASVKFLVPFAALTALSSNFLTPIVPPLAAPAVAVIEPLAKPFFAPVPSLRGPATATAASSPVLAAPASPLISPRAGPKLVSAFLAVWAGGFLIIILRWLIRWSRVRALLREAEARAVQVDVPIAVKFSASRLEPGLVGILRPVILLPQGIERQLSFPELRAVLAHELCHWRRHDNLLAAIHMLVEALFWFFPLVWWLGARLNAERERACDESVLATGNDPEMYAEGILKVCRTYLQSPLACVAGVSGAGLKKRIDIIMENRLTLRLNAARKFVLGTSAAAALILPLTVGLIAAPVTHLQARAATVRNALRAADDEATPSANPNERKGNSLPRKGTVSQSKGETIGQDQTLAPLSPNLSGVLPHETLATPIMIASNSPREATPTDQHAASAQPGPTTATESVVMTDTPSGAGDPGAIACRAPQRIAGSGQFGPQVCLHNYEWLKVAMNGKEVSPDGKTLIAKPMVEYPKGDGDPNAVTCRAPKILDNGARIARFGPEVCQTNRFWADLVKNQQMVDARGVVVRLRPSADYGCQLPTNCSRYGWAAPNLFSPNSGFVSSNNPTQSSGTP